MNKLLVCTLLVSLIGMSNALAGYTKSFIHCSATSPPGTSSSYCVESGFWVNTDCNSLASFTNDYSHLPQCHSDGFLYYWNTNLREVADLSERTTYAECPIDGYTQKVCCPSPKTCHTGNTPANVCY